MRIMMADIVQRYVYWIGFVVDLCFFCFVLFGDFCEFFLLNGIIN